MGIIGRVSSLQQSRQALIFERDTQNEPLGVAARQIRSDRPESVRAFSISFRSFQIPSHRRVTAGRGRQAGACTPPARTSSVSSPNRTLRDTCCRRPSGDPPTRMRDPLAHAPQRQRFAHSIAGNLRQPEAITCHRNGLMVPRLRLCFREETMDRDTASCIADSLHLVGKVGPLSCEVEI